MNKKRITAYLILLFVSILWGVAGPIIKNTLSYFSPSVFLTYRFFLSTLVALVYFSFHPTTLPKTTEQIQHTIGHSVGIIIFGLGLLFFGFNFTDSLTGNLLAATGPVFSIFMGALFLKEHISRHEMIGLTLALLGSSVIVLTSDGAQTFGLFGIAMIGNAFILLSRIADGLGGVATKEALKKGMNPAALSHIAFIIGFFVFCCFTIVRMDGIDHLIRTITMAPPAAHLGVFYMAFISGSLGYYLSTSALKTIELGEASIFYYLTVVWGAPISVLWLGEKLTPQFIVGASIIALGVTIAEWQRKKKKRTIKH